MAEAHSHPDAWKGVHQRIIVAARDCSPVAGLSHSFYRYPARFSPVFVRSVIEAYSEPGDLILDPFAGGGTTLFEAMATDRNALGIDISSLSAFVCQAKTLLLSDQEVAAFHRWRLRIGEMINMHAPSVRAHSYAEAGYYRNLEGREYWRLRKAIGQSISSVERLRLPGSATLARRVVLRTAQWALDARKKRPSLPEFRQRLSLLAGEMIESAIAFRDHIAGTGPSILPRAISIHRSAAGAHEEDLVPEVCPPKLVLTSPPYPGIHVLYHRWQVDGRREAPARWRRIVLLHHGGSEEPKLRKVDRGVSQALHVARRNAVGNNRKKFDILWVNNRALPARPAESCRHSPGATPRSNTSSGAVPLR